MLRYMLSCKANDICGGRTDVLHFGAARFSFIVVRRMNRRRSTA